jgi:hypothetical protein
MYPPKRNTARAMRPAIVAAACLLTAAVAVNAIVALTHASPHLGDIVAFAPSATVPSGDGTRLVVRRKGQTDCVLDLAVLRRSGGSLVVDTEIVGDTGGFGAHWAGPRTSDAVGNCGGDAELLVDHTDLDILAMSAGGYGIGPKRMPINTGDASNFIR